MSGTVVGGQVEVSWFDGVNAFARDTPWLHAGALAFTTYGVVLFAALLGWGWLYARGRTDRVGVAAALWAPLGVFLAMGVAQLISHAVAEPRPYQVLPHALILASHSTDYSFPSDHSVMAGAVAAGLFLVDRRLGLLAGALAVVMALSRVYVGAHFPLDAATGLVVGAVVTVLGYRLAAPVLDRVVTRLERTRLRPLVVGGAR